MYEEDGVRGFGVVFGATLRESCEFFGTSIVPAIAVGSFKEIAVFEEIAGGRVEDRIACRDGGRIAGFGANTSTATTSGTAGGVVFLEFSGCSRWMMGGCNHPWKWRRLC